MQFQGRITAALRPEYSAQFVRNYDLAPYTDPHAPCMFIGLYNKLDRLAVLNHRGLAVQVWCGSDAEVNLAQPWLADEMRWRPIRHVSTSRMTAAALDRAEVKHRFLPVHWVDVAKFKPVGDPPPLGDAVYFYAGQKGREDVYGGEYVDEVRRIAPEIEIVNSYAGDIPRERMPEVYARCFAGLRLKHGDGMAATVCEMGLMGRPSIHNGTQPCALPWSTPFEIAEKLRYLYAVRHEYDTRQLSQDTERYLAMPDGWDTAAFWETWI